MELTFNEISCFNTSINFRINHIKEKLLPVFTDEKLIEIYVNEIETLTELNDKLNNLWKQKLIKICAN